MKFDIIACLVWGTMTYFASLFIFQANYIQALIINAVLTGIVIGLLSPILTTQNHANVKSEVKE